MTNKRRKSEFHIGTSGWHYDHWIKVFYPQKLSKNEWFKFYAKHFNTVELNNTFYHLPKEETVKNWHKKASPQFLFSVKMSRYTTHIKRLKDPKDSTKKFFKRVNFLRNNLGPILHQLPPSFKRNEENTKRLKNYLKYLPDKYKHVIEFRDRSWFVDDLYKVLKKNKVCLCIVNMPGLPTVTEITSGFTYIRFHGAKSIYSSSYSKKELKDWASKIKQFLKDGLIVYSYFNNDSKGYAVKNAKTLIELLA
jgi:uncharacterized protein YecE (DUF72 family)